LDVLGGEVVDGIGLLQSLML